MAQAAVTAIVLALAALAQAAPAQAGPARVRPQEPLCAAAPSAARTGQPAEQIDLVQFAVGGRTVSVCYSRALASEAEPSLGTAAMPYGVVWRTGGSTPAILTTAGRISIAGLVVPAGRYVLYTVPGPNQWQIVINRAVAGWRDGPDYGPPQRATEVGRVTMPAEPASQFAPQLTLHAVAAGPNAVLLLEWQSVRVPIPIMPG
jgi:hypothetical protein